MRGAQFDVAIVVGAAMGSAIACFLAADGGFGGTILVAERDPGYVDSATARSWGGIRQQFSKCRDVVVRRILRQGRAGTACG